MKDIVLGAEEEPMKHFGEERSLLNPCGVIVGRPRKGEEGHQIQAVVSSLVRSLESHQGSIWISFSPKILISHREE